MGDDMAGGGDLGKIEKQQQQQEDIIVYIYIYRHLKIHIIILLSDLDKVPLADWNDWALMGSSKDHFAGAKMEDYTESTFAIRVHWALTSQENKMFDGQGDSNFCDKVFIN